MPRSNARSTECAWRVTDEGITLRVRLTPKSSKDAVDGIAATAEGPAIKARVKALPEDGAANAALTALVAQWLDRPTRSVVLISGAKSRIKTLAIGGLSDRLIAELERRTTTIAHPKP